MSTRPYRYRQAALLFLVLFLAAVGCVSAQTSCPTGSLLVFTKPVVRSRDGAAVTRILIQHENSFDHRIWEAPAQVVNLPSTSVHTKADEGVGFIVPQLERGRYVAWYGAPDLSAATDSLVFDVSPQLIAEQGIVRGPLLAEVEVRVRISSPQRLQYGRTATEHVKAVTRLKVRNEDIAEIITTPTVETDDQGIARWQVRLKGAGITELVASADQFETAVMTLVAMPAAGETFREAQILALRQRDERLGVANDGVRDGTNRVTAGVDSATRGLGRADTRRINDSQMEAGDVLLVLGSSMISDAIRDFEHRQLPGAPWYYSHASLYLGEVGGVKMVAEMWNTGFWITPLAVSVEGTRLVDVYRARGVELAKRQALATAAANAFGDSKQFIRFNSPSFFSVGSIEPYAFEQIGILTLASAGSLAPAITFAVNHIVDPRAGGRRKMICSELVAWAYHDAKIDLEVQPWQSLKALNLFTSVERLLDYTTPNMLAQSKSLMFVGRYREP
ncbi:MAG TPA: hypothetical protein VI306_08030 [Pyrinomonadaceae bacterium]